MTSAPAAAHLQQQPFGRFLDGSAVGDVIPFYGDGAYHLFCLTPPPGTLHFPERLRTTWRHLRSTDLLSWAELPPAVEPGPAGSYDSGGIWTGSVLQAGGRTHLFYTAHMPDGDPRQSICHATSDDLVIFTKDPANPILVPQREQFESRDWRDPFVFYHPDERQYWMIISARLKDVPAAQRGVLALATSADLTSWSPFEPLLQTLLTHCPECPEVYQRGDHWVLAYSRFSDRRRTVYRVAQSPRGPWRTTSPEGPDAAHWYAAKSLVDDQGRQLAFGWIPDREDHDHHTSWLWAGDLALPRQVDTTADGTLRYRPAPEVRHSFNHELPLQVGVTGGDWTGSLAQFTVDSPGRASYAVAEPATPTATLKVTVDVATTDVRGFTGLVLNTTDMLDRGVAILLYPSESSVRAVDLAAPASEVEAEYETMAEQYLPVAEHQFATPLPAVVSLEAYIRGDLLEVFVDGAVCLTYRMATTKPGSVALLVQDGNAVFKNLEAFTLD